MTQFSIQDQKRITFLSLLRSASNFNDDLEMTYADATAALTMMENDGFFEEARAPRPTSAPRGRSDRPASRGQSSRSGSQGNGGFSGYRNPDAPATEKQINAAIKLGADYTDEELEGMTIAEIGGIISDLKG